MLSAHGTFRAKAHLAIGLLAVLFLPLTLCSCFGLSEPPQVAATVNGDPIYEDDVTEFIEGFRKKNSQYETANGWAEFLKSNGYTSETLRSYVIDTVFVPQLLIKQQCTQYGVSIGDTELDQVISNEKEYYEKRYGANSWDSVLASYGYDEKSWRENELNRLLEEQLRSMVIEAVQPTEAEIQAQANESASGYNGKDSYYILFPSQEAAQEARNRIVRTGETITLETFMRLGDAVHAGWNSLPESRDSMSTEYEQASNDLELGHVSEPVYADGSWMLIYCDAVFNVGAGGESVALRFIPSEIYAQIEADATEKKADQLFSAWLSDLASQSDIEVASMPSGLPYNVSASYEE